jgi:hypothetical protein
VSVRCASPEYRVWCGMKQRCFNPNDTSYRNYGGRGITVCDQWRCSFDVFLADMGRRPGVHYSIDRIDNDGNYEPGNCRWVLPFQQAENKRVASYTRPRKLSDGEVIAMRQDWAVLNAEGIRRPCGKLAAKYGVSYATADNAVAGRGRFASITAELQVEA